MTKNRFDRRTWTEVVGDLVSERTSPGDTITLKVKLNGLDKPEFVLDFQTYDPDKKQFQGPEEISDWIDDTPYYELIDDTTGKPLPGEMRRGSTNWRDFIDQNFGPVIQSIIMAGGRIFKYEVIQ